jgi:importin-9
MLGHVCDREKHERSAPSCSYQHRLPCIAAGLQRTRRVSPFLSLSRISRSYDILSVNVKIFPWNIRMRCVSILFSVIRWVATMAKVHQDGRAKVLDPILPLWFAVFKLDMAEPDAFDRPHAVKLRILQVISIMLQEFPSMAAKLVPTLVPYIWGSLSTAVAIWQKVAIEDSIEDPSKQDEETGDKLGFDPYVSMLLEVVMIMSEKRRFHSLLEAGVPDLLYVAMSLGQLTEEQVEDYESDINEFMAAEYSEIGAFNIRSATGDFCQVVGTHFFDHALRSLQLACQKRLAEIEQVQNGPVAWKLREGLEYVVGHVFAGFFKEAQERAQYDEVDLTNLEFDIDGFIKGVLFHDVVPQKPIFLRGRALWCAARLFGVGDEEPLDDEGRPIRTAKFAERLDLVKHFVANAAQTIHEQKNALALRLMAAGAFAALAPMLPADDPVLSGAVGVVLSPLVQLAQHASEEGLHMILDTVSLLLPLHPDATAATAPQLIPALISIWGNHLDDPYVSQLVNENVAALSKITSLLPHLQAAFGPILAEVFGNPNNEQLPGVVETAADIATSLVINSSWPLSEVIMNQVFPLICSRMVTTLDNSFMQSGCSALLGFIRCAKEHLLAWNDGQANGVQYILRSLHRVLDPSLADPAALYLGPLISKLLENLGNQLGDGVPQILTAALVRLRSAKLSSLQQSLILVFIKLMRSNPSETVQFLNGAQVDGQSGLQFLLTTWLAMHEEFHGSYHIKNSIFAMSKLFGESVLDNVAVPGDLAVDTSKGRSSRSKAKAAERQMEPLKVRIFKLLVREHMVIIEDFTRHPDPDSGEDDYDVDNDGGDLDMGQFEDQGSSFQDYEDAFDEGLMDDAYDDDEEETDPDVVADPVYKINLKEYIEGFLQELLQQNQQAFNMFASQLTEAEQDHLRKFVFGQKPN